MYQKCETYLSKYIYLDHIVNSKQNKVPLDKTFQFFEHDITQSNR